MMRSNKSKMSYLSQFLNSRELLFLLIMASISDSSTADNITCGGNQSLISFKHPNFIVLFNPYFIPSEYMYILNEEGLVSIIQKIATEFSTLAIDVRQRAYDKLEYRVPSAVAKNNKLLSSQETLGEPTSVYLFIYPWQIVEIIKIADQANEIYPGSIKYFVSGYFQNDTVLKQIYFDRFHSLKYRNNSKHNYKLGALLPFSICEKNNPERQILLNSLRDLNLLVFREDFGPDGYALGAEEAFERLVQKLEKCRKVFRADNLTSEVALQTSWEDRNPFIFERNYSALVSFWEKASDWSVASNTKVFMKGAIDYPGSNGWWKPLENIKRYHVPKDFVFIDKRPNPKCNPNDDMDNTSIEAKLPEDFDFKHYNFVVYFSAKFATGGSTIIKRTIPEDQIIVSALATEFAALAPTVYNLRDASFPLSVYFYNTEYRNVTNPIHMYIYVDDRIDESEVVSPTVTFMFSVARSIIFKTDDLSHTGGKVAQFLKNVAFKDIAFNLGLIFPLEHCLRRAYLANELDLLRKVQLLIPFIEVKSEDLRAGIDITVKGFFTAVQRCQERLLELNVSSEITLGTQISDYDIVKSDQRYSNFVSFWGKVNYLSKKMNIRVFIKEAIDNIENEANKNYGWWKLAFKPRRYQTVVDYVYEDKTDQRKRLYSNKLASLELPAFKIINVNMTKNPNLCIYFSPLLRREDKWDTYNEEELVPILRQISTSFSSIYALPINIINGRRVSPIPSALATLNRNQAKILPLRLYLQLQNTDFYENKIERLFRAPDELELAEAAKALHPTTDITFVRAFTGNYGNDPFSSLKDTKEILQSRNNSYKQGALFPLRKCGFGSNPPNFAQGNNPKDSLDLIIFELHPEEEDFEVGVQEAVKWFQIVFQRCKDKIATIYNYTEIAFMTSWPGMNLYGGEDVESLIIFWERMSVWAEESNTIVIMKEAFDSPNLEKKNQLCGWWRLIPKKSYESSSDYIFEEKREAFLRLPSISVEEDNQSVSNTVLLAAFLGGTVLLLISVILFLFNRNKRSRYLTEKEINEFLKGNPDETHAPFRSFYAAEKLERKEFSVMENKLLGSGEFGKVLRGSVKNADDKKMDVAVKMTKRPCPKSALNGLLSEIKILQYLGSHPNLVEMIGAFTSELNRGKVLIFLEMCSGGSLEKHLRKCKAKITAENPDEVAINLEKQLENDLRRWPIEIRRGLEYIAMKKIVHMDIATRNILLTDAMTAKISDFGLSRRLYNYEVYVKSGQEPLPWRWIAPESLLQSEFTEKSDVWAFGVTLWEIFTLGDLPYSGLSYNINFGECLRRGVRLGIPTYNKDDIYSVMCRCWALNPESRPAFSELRIALEYKNIQVEDAKEKQLASTTINEYDIIK